MERLENRPARAGSFHASSYRAGISTGLHPSAQQPAGNRQRAAALGGNIFLYRRAGRTLLSRLGAKPIGTPRGTARSAGDRLDIVRPVAFQHTLRPFQLALRAAGHHRRDFLRTRVARAATRAGIDDYPCERGLDLGFVVLSNDQCPVVSGPPTPDLFIKGTYTGQ